MPNFKTSYTADDLQDIVEILEQEKSTIQEIELARNMIKAPEFNYVEMSKEFPFCSTFAPMLEGANKLEATMARDIVNLLLFDELSTQPKLNPELPTPFEAIHRSLIPQNSDLYQLENYILEPEKHFEEDQGDIDWEKLLLFSKAEIHLLKKIGKQILQDNNDQESFDLFTNIDFLSEGLSAIDHALITVSEPFNLLALNSTFEQCKFYLTQQSTAEESAFLITQHLLIAQTSNRLAEYEAIRFYEHIGELGTLKLDKIARQREKLKQEAEKLEKEKHIERSIRGGEKTLNAFDLFHERTKQLVELIWRNDIKKGRELLGPVVLVKRLKELHEDDKNRICEEKNLEPKKYPHKSPAVSTIENSIKKVRRKMNLPKAKSGPNKDHERDYSHLQVEFEKILAKDIEQLREENHPKKDEKEAEV